MSFELTWMPLITITEDAVKTRLSAPELAALQNSALASGQTSPLAEITAGVVAEARGYIPTQYVLEEGDKVPDTFAHHVLAMIRYRLITRLPIGKQLLDEARQKEYDAALSFFRQVAANNIRIPQPVVESVEKSAGPSVAVVSSAPSRFNRKSLNAL